MTDQHPAGESNDAEEQIEIAVRFVDSSGPRFDREGAEKAGLDPEFARDFEENFYKRAQELQDPSTPSSHKQEENAVQLFPAWFNCAVAIASLAGATVSAVAAIFASGGTLAFALAAYGLSGVGVLGSCYDENGNPVI